MLARIKVRKKDANSNINIKEINNNNKTVLLLLV